MSELLYISNIAGKKLSLSFLGSAMYASHKLGFAFHSAANRSAASHAQTKADEAEYGIKLHHIDLERAPYSPKNRKAYKQLCQMIRDEQIDYIHCNTPTGGLLGRLAGRKCKVKRVIYQAHGFHFYKGAPKWNWLIFYPIEKWLARYTDALITVNREDYALAKSKFHLRNNGQVYYVPGVGIDLQKIQAAKTDRNAKRNALGLQPDDLVLISAGRLDANKNHAATIHAIAKVPHAKLLLCGDGAQRSALENLVSSLGIRERVFFLGNRADLMELYQAADIFVMMSLREGLSRSIMEAMASGLPCIVSKIRGNTDLIEHGKNGYCVGPRNVSELAERILDLERNPRQRDAFQAESLRKIEGFSIEQVEAALRTIYTAEFITHPHAKSEIK